MSSDKLTTFEAGEVLLFNKPAYWTSFDLVNKVRIMLRSTFGLKKIKVGHAGTLDPLATGLMIICTGKATKKIDEFRDLDKEYVATFFLGATTPSFDLETETDFTYPVDHITDELIREKLKSLEGRQMQMPPLYSAKFIDGKRAYEFARKGVEKELKPVEITIRTTELLSFEMPLLRVRLVCSKGTYIRSVARDLGLSLNSGSYLSALERTQIGNFRVENAYSLETFGEILSKMKSSLTTESMTPR